MISIFLSHNAIDKSFVRKLSNSLITHGIKTWVDEAELKPGDSLFEKIEEGIKECTYLGVVLSPNSVKSEWVKREVNMALTEEIYGKRVKVIPIIYQKCEIPGFLKEKFYVDFTSNYIDAFKILLLRFQDDLHNESYKTKRTIELLISSYQDWISFDKQDNYLLNTDSLNQVLAINHEQKFSLDILEYIFCSITVAVDKDSKYYELFLNWLKKLKTHEFESFYNKLSN